MKRPEKEAVVAQLTEQFRNADAVYLTEYRGLTVPQISDLREKLGRDTSYTVAKNTLARIAAKEAGIEGLDEILPRKTRPWSSRVPPLTALSTMPRVL